MSYGEPYAWVTMNETAYPIIQTVNSKYFQKVWCDVSAGWIKMQFSSEDAYNYAWDAWHNKARPAMGDYVVVTPESTCVNWDSTQQRYFIRATSEERDDSSKTITCRTADISLTDTTGEGKPMDVNFNNFNQKNGVNVRADASANGGNNFTDNGGEVLGDPSGDSDYDDYLDEIIGPMELEALNKTLSKYGLTLDDFYGASDLPDLATENLVGPRSLRSRIKKALQKVASAVKDSVQVVASAVKTAVDAIVDVAQTVQEALPTFTTINESLTTPVTFDSTKIGNIVTTPFHDQEGYQLLSLSVDQDIGDDVSVKASVDLFCVECGVQGDFNLNGQVSFILSELKFQTGFIDVTGAMHAGLELGIVAEASVNKDFTKPIASIPLSPFTIPGVVIVGPEFTLDAGVSLALGVEGSLLAGATADWVNIHAHIDVVNTTSSFATGFKPDVTPVFDVDGSITFKTTFFIEGALGIGLNFLNGAFDKSVALVDRPGLFISAGLGASFDLNSTDDDFCNGLDIAVGFSNEVSINVFDVTNIPLDDESVTLDSHCFDLFSRRSSAGLPELPAPESTRSLQSRQDVGTDIDDSSIGNSTFDGGIMAELYTHDLGDTSKGLRLRYSPNGNTYAVSPDKVPQGVDSTKEWSGWFAADSSGAFVVGDSHGRFFHAYTDTLATLGVSRMRLHEPDEMPKTAQPIVLAAATLANSTSTGLPYIVASDLGGGIYFPIICIYESGSVYPKIFLAKDPDAGAATLMSNDVDVRKQVTGAAIKSCGYVPITNGVMGVDISQVADES
ncbi:hypothetical protein SBRCBS47491_002374 [Sporothrix bragantina]|uniref:Uncharacterized protein n=1 Tax=Sporothrix bragantina TaxID=671064 RepID=A0ABP0B7E5_9PEZI